MASSEKNLSDIGKLADASNLRVAVITAKWNEHITSNLKRGCIETLVHAGINSDNLEQFEVPGSFELPQLAAQLASKDKYDAIICLGSVIRGETAHFDFVCQGVAIGIQQVAIQYKLPVVFGVLTDDNVQQAIDRSGGKHGNKGVEAAATAISMAILKKQLNSSLSSF